MQPDMKIAGGSLMRGGSRAGPLTLRLVVALALFPIVPAAALLSAEAITHWLGAARLPAYLSDDLQIWMLITTVAVTLISVSLWRRMIVWTAGRLAWTTIAAAVPIAQVLCWAPLWSVGCGLESFLKLGQSTVLLGFWAWATVWIWWGWQRWSGRMKEKQRMSASAIRVLLSFGILPVVVGGWSITWIYFDRSNWFSPRIALALNHLLWSVVTVAAWLLVWRAAVAWTRNAAVITAIQATCFVGVSAAAAFLPEQPTWADTCRGAVPLVAWGLWMIVTVSMWRYRSPPAGQSLGEDLRCRACGYSLRGLYATRCPECGDEPTLDELFAQTAAADA